MTIRSLLGSTFLLLIFIVLIVAGALTFYPQWVASTFGIGPLSPSGIWTLCLSLVAGLGALFWLVERLFDRVGKAGVRVQWRNKKISRQGLAPLLMSPLRPLRLSPGWMNNFGFATAGSGIEKCGSSG